MILKTVWVKIKLKALEVSAMRLIKLVVWRMKKNERVALRRYKAHLRWRKAALNIRQEAERIVMEHQYEQEREAASGT